MLKSLGPLGQNKRSIFYSTDGIEDRNDSCTSIRLNLCGTVVPMVAREGVKGVTVPRCIGTVVTVPRCIGTVGHGAVVQ